MLARRRFLKGVSGIGAGLILAPIIAACNAASQSAASAAASLGASASAAASPSQGTAASSSPGALVANKTIGFDHPQNSQAVWTNLMKFAQERADQVGYKLLKTSDNSDLNTQVGNLQTWITQQVPAIVCYPVEQTAIEPLAQQAQAAGIKWFGYGLKFTHEDGSILYQNYDTGHLLGVTAGDWVNKNLGGNAVVAQIAYPSAQVGRDREKGYLEGFGSKVPGFKIVAREVGADHTTGNKIMTDMLTAHPDINVLLSIDDDAALGAYEAFLAAGRAKDDPKTWIGGCDGTQQALETVQLGGIYRCSVAVSLKKIAYACIDLPKSVLEGGPSQDVVIAPEALTAETPDLLKQYLADYGA
jgi:ABC-type sugar transport system substrate-binding protein